MSITLNNVVYPTGYIAEDDGALKAGRNYINTDNVTSNPVTINGTLTWNSTLGIGSPVTVSGALPGGSTDMTLYATPYDNSNYVFVTNNQNPTAATYKFVLANVPLKPNTTYTADNDPGLTEYTANPPCFAAGTRIRVVRDDALRDVAVETLRVGDKVVTGSGEHRPIRWLGHRNVDCHRHPRPMDVMPVRIAAHAFGTSLPARDLVVSPGHAICLEALGEILVPAAAMIDGESVVQLDVESVTYWHVELESHDILMAENLPAESYLDMGNRSFFAETGTVALHAGPDAPVATHESFCRPFVDRGPQLDLVRARLAERTEALGGARRGTSAAA